MKVGLIGPIHPFRSGEAQSNTMLCENLSQNHEVIAYSFKRLYPKLLFPGKSQTYESEKTLHFTRHFEIDSLDPTTWARTLRDLRRADLDVVLVTWWTIFLAPFYLFVLSGLKRLTKTKICIVAHNVYPHEDSVLNKALARLVLPLADYYLVFSSKSLHELTALYPDAKVKVLLETTYDKHFSQPRSSREEARQKLGISEQNVALFFGLVRPYKGLKYLVSALPRALKDVDLRLLVVGEFWEKRSDFDELAASLGVSHKVTFVDRFVSDEEAITYFDACDVFVLPYTEETGSAVVPLAYGHERPVIVSDVLGLTDFVDDGVTGYIVPPRDAEKLGEALSRFFSGSDKREFVDNVIAKRRMFEWGPDKEAVVFHGLSSAADGTSQ